jgi:sporulation protein YlmC with PRC-barrel domain
MENYVDFLRMVVDHPIIDSDGVPCGMVDDLLIEGGPGETLAVTALLVGPGASSNRLHKALAPLARRIFGSHCVRVPWSEVARVDQAIVLHSTADQLGLGTVDRRLGRWIARIPGA